MHSAWSPVDSHFHGLATSSRARQAPTGASAAAAKLARLRLQARVPGRRRLSGANLACMCRSKRKMPENAKLLRRYVPNVAAILPSREGKLVMFALPRVVYLKPT